ncbi:hypothetical protein KM92DES2_10912 [uncultured Desulfovibrio sp.]|uniref:Uncharacterized protein n=1 Tax=uncultured Desulfovibrio sp. TaxID=167968 RepID=A0A212JD50_9BACT|nr:hypothetical protein KM92DES2_10912 [uncultured Desulfovibrio sp.]
MQADALAAQQRSCIVDNLLAQVAFRNFIAHTSNQQQPCNCRSKNGQEHLAQQPNFHKNLLAQANAINVCALRENMPNELGLHFYEYNYRPEATIVYAFDSKMFFDRQVFMGDRICIWLKLLKNKKAPPIRRRFAEQSYQYFLQTVK